MTLKKIFMASVLGAMLGVSTSGYAFPCALKESLGGICFFGDVLTALANYALNKSEEKLLNPIYDVHAGLEKIKANIGMYIDQGICARSATGAAYCGEEAGGEEVGSGFTSTDLATYTGTQEMMEETLSGLLGDKTTKEKSEEAGDIVASWDAVPADYLEAIGATAEMDTFDKVRANVVAHVFETNAAEINESCTCSSGTGSACSETECAEQRQDRLLAVSSTGASTAADAYMLQMCEYEGCADSGEKQVTPYDTLEALVDQINSGSDVVAQFLGNLGWLSVRGADIILEQMSILSYDVRAQSYRNLMFGGVQQEDLSSLGGGN